LQKCKQKIIMGLKNEKEIFHVKLKEILYSNDYRHLRFVFLISAIVSIYIFVLYTYRFHPDMDSYVEARDYILQNWKFDIRRYILLWLLFC
jgi:hypothetical protein